MVGTSYSLSYIKDCILSSARAGTASALRIVMFSVPGTVPGI